MVAGMLAAPNLGRDYGGQFERIYPDLARKYHASLYPFFLDGVTGDEAMQLGDRVHPNFQGVKRMVTGITPRVLEALGRR
jgi:acyl-CoA thioesterase-1